MEEFLDNNSCLTTLKLKDEELFILMFEYKINPLIKVFKSNKNIIFKSKKLDIDNNYIDIELNIDKFNLDINKESKNQIEEISFNYLSDRYCFYENKYESSLKIGTVENIKKNQDTILALIVNRNFVECFNLFEYFSDEKNTKLDLAINEFTVTDEKGK